LIYTSLIIAFVQDMTYFFDNPDDEPHSGPDDGPKEGDSFHYSRSGNGVKVGGVDRVLQLNAV